MPLKKKTPPKQPVARKPTPKQAAPTGAPFLTQDPVAAYQHFLADAQAVPAASVVHLNIDPDLAVNNVALALPEFQQVQAAVLSAMPSAPVSRFLELPSLALAVLYASDQVVGQASTGEIATRLAALNVLRAPTLAMLEIFANAAVGLADAARVKAIRAGAGSLDKAHDAVNIAGYYTELGAAIAGKHPFTSAQLAQLAEDGQWLIQQLTPTGAVPAPSAVDPAAVIRDQMWTLLSTRYDAMRAAASVVLGIANLDQHLPPLGTRVVRAKKAAAAPAPAAAPPVATATAAAPAK